MHFISVLTASFFFASAVLSNPLLGRRSYARAASAGGTVRQSANMTGVVVKPKNNDVFYSVNGTFVVPNFSGQDSAAAIWVGLSGPTCEVPVLAGVLFYDGDGPQATFGWNPDNAQQSTSMNVSPGDTIQVTLSLVSHPKGSASIRNLSNGQSLFQAFPHAALDRARCQMRAEWILESYFQGQDVVLPQFGSMTFTGAAALGRDGQKYGPLEGTIYELEHDGHIMTSVEVGKSSVTIKQV